MSTMDDAVGLAATPCRSVTADEVDHLHELGWVKLEGFVDPDVIRATLDLAREVMGDDADSNPLSPFLEAAVAEGRAGLEYFNAQRSSGLEHPVLRPLIREVGKRAALLQRRASTGVRYYQDLFVPKLPSYRILDVARAVAPEAQIRIVGIRPGEKVHEEMITATDAIGTIEFERYFVILPSMKLWDVEQFRRTSNGEEGKFCAFGFSYNSAENDHFLTVSELRDLIEREVKAG